MNGGYEAGYLACSCFWGVEPGKLMRQLAAHIPDFTDFNVLDAGCGEDNARICGPTRGARVRAVDI